ncbi:hypothetical protein M404DRAFT_993266 [Pisolithus tinctorius Marx 270]|uniref:Uncharacterized protein n=1 Tax=Pisolithus tinctorius Marx 270 TaxID=870435 RepID=A0A0C3PI25_PISTI|nr:hypothetical protein M404DRAFT_993266 [Pisolithus tinctorius Marx 270]
MSPISLRLRWSYWRSSHIPSLFRLYTPAQCNLLCLPKKPYTMSLDWDLGQPILRSLGFS